VRAVGAQTFAVVDEQPHSTLSAGELRDLDRVTAFADRGLGDRDRIDDVGLAVLAYP
jgi:hypothetical protein